MVAARRDQRTTSVVARQPVGGITGQHPGHRIRSCPGSQPGDDRGVFKCLARTLAEVRRHRMGGVAEQRDPAAVEGRQRCGQLGDIMAEHVLRPGDREQPRDRLCPPPGEPDRSAAPPRRPRRGRGRGGIAVARPSDSGITPKTVPRRFRHRDLPGHRTGEQPPGGEPRVAKPRMTAEQRRARREPIPSAATTRSASSSPAVVATRAAAFPPDSTDVTSVPGEHAAGNTGRQRVDDGRPRQQDDRIPEPVRDHPAGSAAHEPPAVATSDAQFLRDRQRPQPIAGTDRIQHASPLGAGARATPTGSSDPARSQAVTSRAAHSPAAAARPPIPAPITTARAQSLVMSCSAPRLSTHSMWSADRPPDLYQFTLVSEGSGGHPGYGPLLVAGVMAF